MLPALYLGWAFSQMSGPTSAGDASSANVAPNESATPDATPGVDIGPFHSDVDKLTLIERVPFGTSYASLRESLPDLSSLRGGSAGAAKAFFDTEIFGFPFNVELVFTDRRLSRIVYWYGPIEVGDRSAEVHQILHDYLESRYGRVDAELVTEENARRGAASRWTTRDVTVELELTSVENRNSVGLSFTPA